ncbi:stage II sporulation protein M [Paenibacillus sp. YN15]|uniref:stage II sporulation protein M n=1 Tax=Paenibacillus sp. YN15 TaxID=1742774 RepID=UPI000DCBBDB4|nr:stage II sporulation protein M [Paenibacillus sp. YN15]RAV00937.1 stage II sporulation protein M [Paenibacillus sp. YN15]
MNSSGHPLRSYMKEHFPFFLFIFVLFATGIVFGAVLVGALTLEQREEMARHLSAFAATIDQGGGFDSTASFQQSVILHLKWLGLIWVLGLSVIGLPLVFALDFLKGVLVGFTVGYMVSVYSWDGVLFAFVSVLPQNLVIIPAFIIVSVGATLFAIHLVKARVVEREGSLAGAFWRYTATALLMVVALAGAALYEGYLSPELMKQVAPRLLSVFSIL